MKQDIQSLIKTYELRADYQEQMISNQKSQIKNLEHTVSILTEENSALRKSLDSMSAAFSDAQALCDKQQTLLDAFAALEEE